MKKLFLLSILFFHFGFSQSKEDTQQWIEDKYDYYKLDIWFEKDNSLLFKDGNLYVITHIKNESADYKTYQKINLKNINEICIENTGDRFPTKRYHIDLICKVNQNCIENGKIESGIFIPKREGGFFYIEGKNKKYVLRLSLDMSFQKDDLPMRMEKALIHLVKLYGGNAKKYIPAKETF